MNILESSTIFLFFLSWSWFFSFLNLHSVRLIALIIFFSFCQNYCHGLIAYYYSTLYTSRTRLTFSEAAQISLRRPIFKPTWRVNPNLSSIEALYVLPIWGEDYPPVDEVRIFTLKLKSPDNLLLLLIIGRTKLKIFLHIQYLIFGLDPIQHLDWRCKFFVL